jgi:SAM-dependent methyltransferase
MESFDTHAKNYSETLRASLAFAGADHLYYAERKISALTRFLVSRGDLRPKRVLDFGCGTGTNLPLLRDVLPSAELHGTDVSEKSLDIAQKLGIPGCEFRPYEGDALPYSEHSFDLVMIANVLHHVPPAQRGALMQSIAVTLTPGGIIAIFEHNPFNPITRRVVRDCPFDEGVILLRPRESAELMRGAGVQVNRIDFLTFAPAALSFIRGLDGPLRRVPLGAQYAAFGSVPSAA